ncbi:integrase, partial [Paraburkholderia sp. SIMBA_009]
MRPSLGSLEVRKITPSDIVFVIENFKRSWTICKRMLTTMTQFFDHAAGRKIIQTNPTFGIKLKSLLGQRP